MADRFYVYVLFRANGVPFYLGKGTGHRWMDHEAEAKAGSYNPRKDRIVLAMLRDGWKSVPKIKVHEGLTHEQACAYEMALIAAIGRSKNGPLVNMTDGGEGCPGIERSPEAKRRSSERMTAVWADPVARAAMAAAISLSRDSEFRASMSRLNKGRRHTPKAIEANRNGQLKRFATTTHGPATRQKLKISTTAIWADPEKRSRLLNGRKTGARSTMTRDKRQVEIPL